VASVPIVFRPLHQGALKGCQDRTGRAKAQTETSLKTVNALFRHYQQTLWPPRLYTGEVSPMKRAAKAAFDPKVFLAKVGKGRTLADYKKNQKVFLQGDPADAIFYIQSGKVKLTVVSKQGKEAVVAILGSDDFFGEGCLAGQPLRMARAAAMSECSIMRLDKSDVVQLLHDEPAFSELFLRYLLSRNIRIEEDLVDHLFNSSEKRLARVLLMMANFGKEGKVEPVIPKISQETLAEIVGTTRSRVSFFMNRFRKLGFIEYNGRLEVHSSLLNIVLHDSGD
jgi:CRP/FNR family cyclic AMP-dependent transcriptional regulator